MKGTVTKAPTNIKPMAGGDALKKLLVGEYVFGNVRATDILDFDHYYDVNNNRIELGQMCKAWTGYMILTNEPEPTNDNPPPPSDDILIVEARIGGVTKKAQFERVSEWT